MIDVNRLVVKFEQETVLDNLSFNVRKGAKVAVTGLSGSGKSTLLNVLLGFIIPDSGDISIAGHSLQPDHIHKIRAQMAWLPQELNLRLDKVRDLLLTPFLFTRNKALMPDEKEITAIFEAFRLETNLLNKSLHEISGGQKQRVALASCVLLKRPLLLLDEPTAALDTLTRQDVMDYLFRMPELTILALTHDLDWIARSTQSINLNIPSPL